MSVNQSTSQDYVMNKSNPKTLCTVFVGGITLITTQDKIEEYFIKFGKIHKIIIPFDENQNLQRFKGYALITFEDKESADECLKVKNHMILNRKVHCSRALSKKEARAVVNDKSKRKLFVGGLSQKTTQESLLKYFSKFGEVDTAYLIYDKNSNNSRCFGFVEFVDNESAKAAHDCKFHDLDGKQIVTRFQVLKKDKRIQEEMKQQEEKQWDTSAFTNSNYYANDFNSQAAYQQVPYDPIPDQQPYCPPSPYTNQFFYQQSLPYQHPAYYPQPQFNQQPTNYQLFAQEYSQLQQQGYNNYYQDDYYCNSQNNYNFQGYDQYNNGYSCYENQLEQSYYEEDCYNPRQYSNDYSHGYGQDYEHYESYGNSNNNSVVYEKCQGSSNEGSNSTMDEKAENLSFEKEVNDQKWNNMCEEFGEMKISNVTA